MQKGLSSSKEAVKTKSKAASRPMGLAPKSNQEQKQLLHEKDAVDRFSHFDDHLGARVGNKDFTDTSKRAGAAARGTKPITGSLKGAKGLGDVFGEDKSIYERIKGGFDAFAGFSDAGEWAGKTGIGQRLGGLASKGMGKLAGTGLGRRVGGVASKVSSMFDNKSVKATGGVMGAVGDMFGGGKSLAERFKSVGDLKSNFGDLKDSKWGSKIAGLAGRAKNSKIGQAVGGLAGKFGASKFGQAAGGWAKKGLGALDGFAGKGAGALNKVADGGRAVTKAGSALLKKGGSMKAAKGAFSGAMKAGARAGTKSAAMGGMKALGKAAGRFAPGANVAIAAMDAKHFYDTLNDKDASTADKVFAGITAGGSALAATNIPVLSQIGAGVSLASSAVEAIGPENIAKGAKWAGKKVGQGAKWAGKKIGQGAKWAGDKIGQGVGAAKKFGKKAWNGAKSIGNKFVGGAKSLASGAKKRIGGAVSSVGKGLKKAFSGW